MTTLELTATPRADASEPARVPFGLWACGIVAALAIGLLAVRQPALAPLAPLPGRVVIPAQAEGPAGVSMAQSANVAVITTTRGAYTTVALPSGKAIANLPAIEKASALHRSHPMAACSPCAWEART